MEFANRKKCIEHYQGQFPNLPQYMIEMALDYDLQGGGTSNEKPKTGAQKRKEKMLKKQHADRDTSIQDMISDALSTGKPIEIDAAEVITASEYKMPPLAPGYIHVDGLLSEPEPEPEPEPEAEIHVD